MTYRVWSRQFGWHFKQPILTISRQSSCAYILCKKYYYCDGLQHHCDWSLGLSQCSNRLAKIMLTALYHYLPFLFIYTYLQLSEVATVLGQLPDCLLGECDIRYIYLPQMSAVRCQCQHTLLCHLTAIQCDLLQVPALIVLHQRCR